MKKHIKILLLEDNPDDVLLLTEVLESSEEINAELLNKERLADAIEALNHQHVDVAIVDLNLPDSYGLATFFSFHEAHPRIPVIIMTGLKDREIALKAVNKGAQDYLFKGEPSPDAIVRIIRYSIERQKLLAELQAALDNIKTLKGLLPICAYCKKIRDDKGYWNQLENYIEQYSDAQFSHGICEPCADKLYKDSKWYQKRRNKDK